MRVTLSLLAGISLVAGHVSAQVTVPQPLLRYTFDEASGDAIDTGVAPASNGVLTGGAARSSDTPSGTGSSVSFTPESPYAHVLSGDAQKLDGLPALTLTTWLELDAYTSGNNRLVAKQEGDPFGGFSLNMNAVTNDGPVGPDNFKLALFLGGTDGFGLANSSVDVDATSWTFIATTFDSASNTVLFYTGGINTPVTQLGAAQLATVNPGSVDGQAARFGVGFTDAAPTANTSAIGRQDDVRVYGSALTIDQLEAIRLQNVPEPGAAGLLALGALGMLRRRR